MKYIFPALFIALFILVASFRPKSSGKDVKNNDVVKIDSSSVLPATPVNSIVKNSDDAATSFVAYAKTLIGTPYLYGSMNPARGLDCSGFVNYVSDHFGIKVPRSSTEFTNLGTDIETANARPGDLILFTGTNASKRVVGHIGIVTNNSDGEVEFIHSSSGRAKGVSISELKGYYETRLVKIIRIFPVS